MLKDLWRHIVLSTAVGVGVHLQKASQSEVAYFASECVFVSFADENVLWFDVSVDDVKVVYGLDPPDELGKNADGFLEGEDLVD